MEKGVALGAYVNEAGVQSGHELAHTAQIDVADRVAGLLAFFVLVFHQILVLEQGHRNLFRLNIDDEFACHVSVSCYLLYSFSTLKERTVETR